MAMPAALHHASWPISQAAVGARSRLQPCFVRTSPVSSFVGRHRRCASHEVLHTKSISLAPAQAFFTPQEIQLEEEELEELIEEIKAELALYGHNNMELDLLQALNSVDLIERLGIQRYFQDQILRIVRSVYIYEDDFVDLFFLRNLILLGCRQWDEKSGFSNNAEITVLAFRLLRLHGYPVSAGVLATMRDSEKGFHACFSIQTQRQLLCMLNLYKCSQLGFPSETKIMDEVMGFSRTQLHKALSEGNSTLLESNNLKIAIKFALEFPRRYLLPRLESRSTVRQLWPAAEGSTRKYVQLAKSDLQALQKLYQQELHELDRWWTQHGFDEVKCARKQLAKVLFTVAASMYEPEFSAQRLAFAKIANLTIIVDDMFDDTTSDPTKFRRFNEAIKSWDPSLLGDLPQHKLVLNGLCSTVEDIAAEASKIQNQDILPLFKDLWICFVGTYAIEAEWTQNEHIPSLEEYMKVAYFSNGATIITWTSVFLTGEQITDEICSHIGIDSRFMYLVGYISRLSNDLAGFEKEAREGKMTTAVSCYMRDHPEYSQEKAIAILSQLIESSCQELELEIYRSRAKVPECCSRALLGYVRGACLIYKKGEGFSGNVAEFMEVFKDYLFHSLE